jgi:hypothetical protein
VCASIHVRQREVELLVILQPLVQDLGIDAQLQENAQSKPHSAETASW